MNRTYKPLFAYPIIWVLYMESIRIKNLRSFEDTNEIELNKLNILVGKNASGKSTLLRVFPLLKQTVETKTSEPILWYGNYVDFGDFESAIRRGAETEEIEFTFKLKVKNAHNHYLDSVIPYPTFLRRIKNAKSNDTEDSAISITVSIVVTNLYISKMSIHIYDYKIDLHFKFNRGIPLLESIFIDDKRYIIDENEQCNKLQDTFIPLILRPYLPWGILEDKKTASRYFVGYIFYKYCLHIMQKITKTRSKPTSIYNFLTSIALDSRLEMYENMKNKATKFPNQHLIYKFFNEKNNPKNDDLIELTNLIILLHIPNILNCINDVLTDDILNMQYIAPLRAVAERYCRIRGISIKEIDPMGENTPMYLYKLNKDKKREFDRFNDWLTNYFNMSLKISKNKGLISINIVDSYTNEEINLLDTGFGYSQIIPILVLLWEHSLEKSKRPKHFNGTCKLIAIEQPELHLHPAMQSKLINSIVELIEQYEEKGMELKFILETHSETIVNYIGYLIATGKLSHDSVNVYIFEKKNGKSVIKKSKYDEDGALINWPMGFFFPDDD